MWAWNNDHHGEGSSASDYLVFNQRFNPVWSRVYPYQNFLSVLAFAWQSLILFPFSLYLLGVIVRFLVWLHQGSKQPTWVAFAMFLPIFVILECVLGLRTMIIQNIKHLMWYLLLPYDFSNIGPYVLKKKIKQLTEYNIFR